MLLPDTGTGSTQPSSGPSSSPRASSSAARPPPPPSYLSARSADVILSEVRPTRIKTEALRSVNVLLDELLWLILGCARSFSPDRLRTGLLKVLPTVLGKDALLEAEVELRAYIERNPPASPVATDEAAIQKFPLQQAFELLRIKCEAYSSLGDQEEKVEIETALHARITQISGDATLKLAAVAPAALYLTAILEHVCEHVLSNVGRVVARDSSRTAAHSHDLYVALCEDESIYSLFKTMKVQAQIKQQSNTVRPRRSKSFTRNDLVTETAAAGKSTDTPAVPKQRQSYDSAASNGSSPNLPNRASVEKGRSKTIFKPSSRTAGDNENTITNGAKHHRTNSLLGDRKTTVILPVDSTDGDMGLSPVDDDGSMQDFDDLMRSGTTMKVSLTPDRLKTFEVFAKEKNQRANRPGVPPSSREASSPPSSFPNGHRGSQNPRNRNQVDSIAEAPEGDSIRLRAATITNPTAPNVDPLVTTQRSRSLTDPRSLSSSLARKRSDNSDALPTMSVAMVNSSAGIPKNSRRQPARNRESIDLDDLMDGSDSDMPIKRTVLTPKAAQATSSGARDLMEFLSEGPPVPPSIVVAPSSGTTAPESRGAKPGRFRTIVSRLTGGSSNEKLSPRAEESFSEAVQRPSVNGGSAPSRAPLLSKKSVPNVATVARSSAPPISSLPLESAMPATGLRPRQLSLNRKAVPPWEGLPEKVDPPVPPKTISRQGESTGYMKPLPRPAEPASVQSSSEDNAEAATPVERRVSRDVDHPARDTAVTDAKPSSPITAPNPTNGCANVDQPPVEVNSRGSFKQGRPDAPPGLTLSIPTGNHVGDFRRLMARATSADECRVLVEMFLAKCGALPTDEAQLSGPITPPMSPVRIEVDSHEARLIDVLLGDDGASHLQSPATTYTTTEPIADPSSHPKQG
ncbi:hypothetical protein JB92DRAFT_3109275 [Gautieria morchelliformis]|nr:hypothetical protein JB92DRAFT_3109275 [Gautieria morchelliformis]